MNYSWSTSNSAAVDVKILSQLEITNRLIRDIIDGKKIDNRSLLHKYSNKVFTNAGEKDICPWCKTKGWVGYNKKGTGWYLKKRCKCEYFPIKKDQNQFQNWGESLDIQNFLGNEKSKIIIRYYDINDFLIYTLQQNGKAGVFNRKEFHLFNLSQQLIEL